MHPFMYIVEALIYIYCDLRGRIKETACATCIILIFREVVMCRAIYQQIIERCKIIAISQANVVSKQFTKQ